MLEDKMNIAFQHLHMPEELACNFLAIFSRAEHALKSSKFAIGNSHKVEAGWDKFANSINDSFLKIKCNVLQEAKMYLLQHPPKKQILENGLVVFVNQNRNETQNQTQQLLLMIRTVRNNLFHGGKYLPGGEIEPGRNMLLVQHSITILMECIKLNDMVYKSFQE
jgi:hypothetical protein